MLDALLWGSVAAVSLLIGTWLGLIRSWPARPIGLVLAFGGGALIASISFELAEAAVNSGGPIPTAVGLALGALTFYVGDRLLAGGGDDTESAARAGAVPAEPAAGASGTASASAVDAPHRHHLFHHTQYSARCKRRAAGSGAVLAMGACLDGIPEQVVLGGGLAAGEGVGMALLIAVFVSNIPEAMGSAADMRADGSAKSRIWLVWISVFFMSVIAALAGRAAAEFLSPQMEAGINGFAGGALLVMLVDSLFPEAREKGGRAAGLVTVLGFALGAGISLLTA